MRCRPVAMPTPRTLLSLLRPGLLTVLALLLGLCAQLLPAAPGSMARRLEPGWSQDAQRGDLLRAAVDSPSGVDGARWLLELEDDSGDDSDGEGASALAGGLILRGWVPPATGAIALFGLPDASWALRSCHDRIWRTRALGDCGPPQPLA